MSKQELLAELKKVGQLDVSRRTPLWEQAFNLYNATFPQAKKSMSCGGCFNTVRRWLQS